MVQKHLPCLKSCRRGAGVSACISWDGWFDIVCNNTIENHGYQCNNTHLVSFWSKKPQIMVNLCYKISKLQNMTKAIKNCS